MFRTFPHAIACYLVAVCPLTCLKNIFFKKAGVLVLTSIFLCIFVAVLVIVDIVLLYWKRQHPQCALDETLLRKVMESDVLLMVLQ